MVDDRIPIAAAQRSPLRRCRSRRAECCSKTDIDLNGSQQPAPRGVATDEQAASRGFSRTPRQKHAIGLLSSPTTNGDNWRSRTSPCAHFAARAHAAAGWTQRQSGGEPVSVGASFVGKLGDGVSPLSGTKPVTNGQRAHAEEAMAQDCIIFNLSSGVACAGAPDGAAIRRDVELSTRSR